MENGIETREIADDNTAEEAELVLVNFVIDAKVEAELVSSQAFGGVLRDLTGQLMPRSQERYRRDALYFRRWLEEQGYNLEDTTRSLFIAYREHLAGKYAGATAARMFTIARRLLDEAVQRGILSTNPAIGLRGFKADDGKSAEGNSSPHTALNKEQAEGLLRGIDRTTPMGKRDFALLMLLLRTGLRRSEAAALTLEDLGTEQGYPVLVVQHGKGDKRRRAKLPPDVLAALNAYLEATERLQLAGTKAPLFIQFRKGGRVVEAAITDKLIWRVVKQHAARLETEEGVKLSPHGLRASFVTLALEGGARLHQVQYAVGHADPRTTERYQKRKLNLQDNAVDYLKLEI